MPHELSKFEQNPLDWCNLSSVSDPEKSYQGSMPMFMQYAAGYSSSDLQPELALIHDCHSELTQIQRIDLSCMPDNIMRSAGMN